MDFRELIFFVITKLISQSILPILPVCVRVCIEGGWGGGQFVCEWEGNRISLSVAMPLHEGEEQNHALDFQYTLLKKRLVAIGNIGWDSGERYEPRPIRGRGVGGGALL